jgi:hypothetical protein
MAAYFSNGTQGMFYQSEYCDNCMNWKVTDDDEFGVMEIGCPIWDLHLCQNTDDDMRDILDYLIPVHDGRNEQCIWFEKKLNVETYEEAIRMELDDWKFAYDPPQDSVDDLELVKATRGIQIINHPRDPEPCEVDCVGRA